MKQAVRTLLAAAAVSAFVAPAFAQDVPLIPREKLFGNPSQTAGRISPDGKWLSWTAPRDGVLNIWVAPTTNIKAARALTAETKRPIRNYFWAPDSRQVLFVNDAGGDENFLLYGVDVASGVQRSLTPFQKTRVQVTGISNRIKDRILVGVNNRDPKWHDIHSLDLKTGKLTLVMRNDGYASFVSDNNLKLRLASKARPDGGQEFYRMTDGVVEAKPFASIGLDDSLTTTPAGFTADGKTLHWIDSRGRNTAALMGQDVASGRMTMLAQNAKADIGEVLLNPRTYALEAYSVNYLKPEWKAVDKRIEADLAFLTSKLGGYPVVTSRTDDDGKWTVAVDPVTGPTPTYLYDRRAKTLTQMFVNRPELVGAPLVAMQSMELRARDGMTLTTYMTLPKGADADGDGRADRPVPMVLLVHGGPWSRDDYGYDSYHQWLANRGYAVMSVNYRGSTGFGKNFISAGDLQWGRKMHDDLIDAVDYAIANKVTTADKVAIMGGSYGGYATLAGLTFTPDKFACGVDIVGPSNLMTLLATIPPYWEAGKQQFYQRMGNPTTEAGRALLKERSPLTYADRIKKPLLIGQGANDPRVNVAESEQIVAAMKAKNIPVTYVVFPDEGHGFARPANNIAFNAVTENFLAKCLGGRAEPIGDALKPSTAQVPHGAEFAPGLAAAITARK